MPNIELMKQTLAYIETHPEEWDQKQWSCGTSFCFAGHAVRLGLNEPLDLAPASEKRPHGPPLVIVHRPETRCVALDTLARELLEIDKTDAVILFHPSNDLLDLRNHVRALELLEAITPRNPSDSSRLTVTSQNS